ncbi:Palmitoyltransferase ZDHHC15B [Cucumispora dikerogammari]|nr:Palmitoyltransferase ZDHHC15B [Cucumispora dikerogammari]
MECPPANKKLLYHILLLIITVFYFMFYYTIFKININPLFLYVPHNFLTILIIFYIYQTRKANTKPTTISDNYAMTNDLEFCRKCQRYKPERAHHCSRCSTCILKMDHHCVFLDKCIGSENLANFIRLSFFSSVASLFMCMASGYVLYEYKEINPILDTTKTKFSVFCLFAITLMMGVVGAYLCYFTGYHIYGAARNLTFLEREVLEEMRKAGFGCERNPYDLGVYKNLRLVLGKWYFFFLGGESKEGVYFIKTYFITKWPPLKIQDLWRM